MKILKFLVVATFFGMLASPAYAETTKMFVDSDPSWKATKVLSAGWHDRNFNDFAWPKVAAPSAGSCSPTRPVPLFTMPMWAGAGQSAKTVYFRKNFGLSQNPVSAKVTFAFDDDGVLYINGTHVYSDTSGTTEKTPIVLDVTDYLVKGANEIAMSVTDSRGGCQWVQIHLEIDMSDVVDLGVPQLKQTDYQWNSLKYDTSDKNLLNCGKTIGDCGCALTSLAMVLNFYGVTKGPSGLPTTPQNLNNYFLSDSLCGRSGCMSRGYVFGNVRWSATNRYTKETFDVFGTQKVQDRGSADYSRAKVLSEIDAGRPLIAKAKNFDHWVAVSGYDSGTELVRDPLFSVDSVAESPYNGDMSKLRLFELVHSDFSQIEIYVKAPEWVLVTDPAERRTGFDGQKVVIEIPNSTYQFEESSNSNPLASISAGVHALRISLPENGDYQVQSSGEVAIYASTQDATEKYALFPDGNGKITYHKEHVDEIFFTSEGYPACTLSNPLVIPLKMNLLNGFEVKNYIGYGYFWEEVPP